MMRLICNRLITQASTLLKCRHFSRCSTLYLSKQTNENDPNSKLTRARNLLPKRYKVFDDNDTEIIYDNSIDFDVILNQKQKKSSASLNKADITNLRGEKGVFDIEELIVLLKEENMKDVATIKVPKELKYCEYMVLCSATSFRHIKTFLETFNQLYKIKKNKRDPFLRVDDDPSKNWRIVDLGNIILHVFLKETREYYDIETLWTVGEEFDDKIQRPETDVVKDILDKHLSFIEQQSKSVNLES